MEEAPNNTTEVNFYQRHLFNYKLAWDNNTLDWLDVANKILAETVEVELPDGRETA